MRIFSQRLHRSAETEGLGPGEYTRVAEIQAEDSTRTLDDRRR